MSYQIVSMKPFYVAGISARTNNSDPGMGECIGKLWSQLFETSLAGKGLPAFGVYSGYENGVEGAYTVTAGFRVDTCPTGLTHLSISGGNYAMFSAPGGAESAAALWQEIWATPLDRAFTADFEEYCTGSDGTPKELRIYIALQK